jgi:hypothetical protein
MAMKSVGKNLIFKNKKLLSGTWKISHYLGIQEVLDYLSFFFLLIINWEVWGFLAADGALFWYWTIIFLGSLTQHLSNNL